MAVTPGLAQQKPDFAAIRKTDLAVIDRGNVEAWVNQQMQQLMTVTDNDAVKTLGTDLLDTISTHYKAADATAKFKDGVAELLTKAFLVQYKPVEAGQGAPRPLAVFYGLLTLNVAARVTPDMIQAFTKPLSDPNPSARLMAILGLLQISKDLTPVQWTALLPQLKQTGIAETNSVVLSRLYELLSAAPAPQVAAVVPIMADILDVRLTDVERSGGWPQVANAEAAAWLGDKIPALGNPQLENRATLQIARLLADAVHVYAERRPPAGANPGQPAAGANAPQPAGTPQLTETQQENLEKIIMAAEAQLVNVLRRKAPTTRPPSPDVRAAVFEGPKAGTASIMLALNKWIGTAQDAGILNAAPFNFERGLGIKRAGATAPAPAPAAP